MEECLKRPAGSNVEVEGIPDPCSLAVLRTLNEDLALVVCIVPLPLTEAMQIPTAIETVMKSCRELVQQNTIAMPAGGGGQG